MTLPEKAGLSTDRKHVTRVSRVHSCELTTTQFAWPFAEINKARIEQHWSAAMAANPLYFNGRILMLRRSKFEEEHLSAEFFETDFKNFLYWRDQGEPQSGARDGFGSALIRSAEGHILLGRQRAGHINEGRVYCPGGFIDARDVDPKGCIDIDASILREVQEETGLAADQLEKQPGYWLTECGQQLSIALELRSSLPAADLRNSILRALAGDGESELADIVIVRSTGDLERLNIVPFTRLLLQHVL